MVSLGLGTFLIVTLHLVQHALVKQMTPDDHAQKPNAVLFDVQADQRAGVLGVLTNQHLPVFDVWPVVTMRIRSVGIAGGGVNQRPGQGGSLGAATGVSLHLSRATGGN